MNRLLFTVGERRQEAEGHWLGLMFSLLCTIAKWWTAAVAAPGAVTLGGKQVSVSW